MFRLSPRRNQRSKGFKVKHALQIFLLLGVSIWLLYQLRNSRDKKASFGEGNKSVSEIAKLGRKDLQPQLEEPTIRDARHKEEENEEEIKNEEEQNKFEESDDVVKGHGDDEIDVHDKDKVEGETEHRWDSVDGEKEKEENKENISEDKESDKDFEERSEKENEENTEKGREGKESEESNEQTEEKENEESNDKEREVKAFEENRENEGENKGFEESKVKESKENENEESKEKQSKDKENEDIKENRSEEDQGAEKREGSNEIHSREEAAEKEGKIEERGTSEDQVQDGSDSNNKAREERYKGDDAASKVVHENQNITTGSELGNWENPKVAEQVENRGINDFEQESKTNSTEAVDANHNDSEKSVGETENFENRDSTNATSSEDGGSQPELQNGPRANTTLQNVISQETEKSEPAANNEQQNSSETPYTRIENGGVQTEFNRSSVMDGNNDVILNTVNSADAGQNENDNADQSSTDAGQKEPVDSQEEREASSNTYSDSNASQNDQVDSSISQEEKEARTNLETLPETTTQGHNNDDTAAE